MPPTTRPPTGLRTPRRLTVEKAGTFVLLLTTLAVLVVVGLSGLLSLAADDLYTSVDAARGKPPPIPRSQPGIWLAEYLASDLVIEDLSARNQRADQLAYRSERVREAAAVAALVGLLVALLTAKPRTEVRDPEASRLPAKSQSAT